MARLFADEDSLGIVVTIPREWLSVEGGEYCFAD